MPFRRHPFCHRSSTNMVIATVPVGGPYGVAVNPAGTRVYVANFFGTTVSVINASTNSVIDTVQVGNSPSVPAVNPAGTRVYVTNYGDDTVSVIDTVTNSVIKTVSVGDQPEGAVVHPAGTRVYVTNYINDTVSVIDTETDTVIATVPVGDGPASVAIGPAVTPQPGDLALTKTDSPDPVAVGDNLVYTITVTNNSPDEATSVTVTDTLPSEAAYVSASSGQGSCIESEGTVSCELDNMAGGATATVTIVVKSTAAGTITNTASVTGNEEDPDTSNNTATATTQVNPAPLTIGVSSLSDGEVNLEYTDSLEISGGSPPYEVSVMKGSLPAGLTVDSDGIISGTPTQEDLDLYRSVTDQDGASVSKELKIKIFKAIVITTKSLKKGKVEKKYAAALKAAGGKKPYTWSITSGSLPSGLTLDETTGKITGMPTEAGSFDLTIEVTDELGGTAEKELTLEVK